MVLLILLLVFLILLSGFLSGSETALFSLSQPTLKAYKFSGHKRLHLIASLMDRPRDVLVTILMLNVLANLLVQNVVSSLFDHFDDWSLQVGLPLALTLIFGEVLPKSLSLPSNERVAFRVAPLIKGTTQILNPIPNPLTKATSWISRFLFSFLKKEKAFSADELRHVLHSSEESGILLPQECDLISGSLDPHHSLVKERKWPREEILYYDIQDPLSKLFHLFIDLETTRVPICDGDIDKVLGILSTGRFFFHRDKVRTGEDLRPILKKPYFVPETTKAWALLRNLRER